MHAVSWKKIVKLCEEEGCLLDRERGDHYIMVKVGLRRPIVIPKKKDLKEDIVFSIAKTLGMTDIRERLKTKRAAKDKPLKIPPNNK